MRNWRMCESANLHFCGSTLFYADSWIRLFAVCVLGYAQLANVRISKFAFLRIYKSANLRICGSTLFYADSRICLFAVCVLSYAQLANVRISKFAYLRILSQSRLIFFQLAVNFLHILRFLFLQH